MMERKFFAVETKRIDEKKRIVTFVASSEIVDRDGEVVLVDGIDVEKFMKNPVVLFQHRMDQPVGKVVDIRKTEKDNTKRLEVDIYITDKTDRGKEVWGLIQDGVLNAVSIGFIPREHKYQSVGNREVRVFTDVELLEISIVSIPANPDALIERGYDDELIEKAVVPYKKYPTLDEDTWDAAKERKLLQKWASDADGNINFAKYKLGFAWFDDKKPENVTSYKYPHHAVRDGRLYTHKKGVQTAMAFLIRMVSTGNSTLPAGEVAGVYRHLKKHYDDMNLEAPEMRAYSVQEFAKLFPPDIVFDVLVGEMEMFKEVFDERIKALESQLTQKQEQDEDDAEAEVKELVSALDDFVAQMKKIGG